MVKTSHLLGMPVAGAGGAVHMLGWGPLCAFLILLSDVNCSKNKVFFKKYSVQGGSVA